MTIPNTGNVTVIQGFTVDPQRNGFEAVLGRSVNDLEIALNGRSRAKTMRVAA